MLESVLTINQGTSLQKRGTHVDPEINDYLEGLLSREHAEGFIWDVNSDSSQIPGEVRYAAGFINLHRINDISRINQYLEAVNRKFEYGQYFVIAMETMTSRKRRILNKFPRGISRPYYVLDFLLKRVFPKWRPTRRIYFWLTKGRNQVISLTEGLARMVCCGFDIVDFKQIGYKTYIVGRKVSEPAYDRQPKYGVLIRLRRIGKDGKELKIFKMRTMYPYSEYLQNYIFEKHNVSEGGKFNNDFRMTSWGRVFRKYWLDELPMIINWFRREMKLVGVRPLSRQYFELYPKELQERRIKVKPGLIPPYYADLPNSLEEIQESERRYLMAYEKSPFLTDMRYFCKVFINIVFKGARSK